MILVRLSEEFDGCHYDLLITKPALNAFNDSALFIIANCFTK